MCVKEYSSINHININRLCKLNDSTSLFKRGLNLHTKKLLNVVKNFLNKNHLYFYFIYIFVKKYFNTK